MLKLEIFEKQIRKKNSKRYFYLCKKNIKWSKKKFSKYVWTLILKKRY